MNACPCDLGHPEACAIHGDETDCDYAGHDWARAGGGLLICVECEAEAWEDETQDFEE